MREPGWHHTEESKMKISQSKAGHKLPPRSKEWRLKKSISMKGNKLTLGWKMPEKQKKAIGARMKGNKHTFGKKASEKRRAQISAQSKINWQNPEYVKKWMKSNNIRPNKAELKLNNLLQTIFSGEYKFVGDGEFVISGKCPDFVNINGKKKIIELYGDYWHKGENPQDRIDLFKQYGYDTLVIWEKELNDINQLGRKLMEF